ncbi:MAG TPA: Holliday junction resolvase RecU [Pyrinomonadaceae bacterium]|jgi:recombination protein U
MTQPNLPGAKSANHAHLGRDLEDLLSRTHEYYRARGMADMEKNPVEWKYISKFEYDKLKAARADIVAVTNNNRYIKRVKSDVDFAGVGYGRYFTFDAKETAEKNLPLSRVAEHQLRTLLKKEQCGGVAGLMILFSSVNRLFFVPASVVDAATVEMLYKKGRKSLSLDDCVAKGKEIQIAGNLADWLKVLF